MIRHIAILVAAAIVACAAPASAESGAADPARIAAARDLLEVTGVSKQLDGMVDAMKTGFARGAQADSNPAGEKASKEFDAAMAKLMQYKGDMMTDFAALYAETFTTEEMKSVADFYRSGAGAKFISVMPQLMQKGAEIGMKYSEKIAAEMKASPPQ